MAPGNRPIKLNSGIKFLPPRRSRDKHLGGGRWSTGETKPMVISQGLKLSLGIVVKEVQVESKVLEVEVAVAVCYYGNSGDSVDCGVSWFLWMVLENKQGEGKQLKKRMSKCEAVDNQKISLAKCPLSPLGSGQIWLRTKPRAWLQSCTTR